MTITPTVPPAANAAGYKTLTFGPQMTVGSFPGDTGNWQRFNFFSNDWTKTVLTAGNDGSITLYQNGSNTYAAVLCSASFNQFQPPPYMHGMAFGGGGYFEAIITQSLDDRAGGATFWSWDAESIGGSSAGDNTLAQWPGQAAGFGDTIEIDFAEFDPGTGSQQYGTFVHNWYGLSGQNIGAGSTNNVPIATDFAVPHRYGFLWVPATATTQGKGSWFFDDSPIGTPIVWNLYNPALAPPPVNPGSAFSIVDKRHLVLILGNFGSNPVTFHGVSVWQASAASNIVR